MNRMKEKTIENLLVKLVHMCGLGKIIADVESVSGGLMHRMYKVITDSGVYAVKHLNAEIMKRPDVHENYARAEKIEGILENSDIPIVPAIVIGGNKMQKIDDQFSMYLGGKREKLPIGIIFQMRCVLKLETSLEEFMQLNQRMLNI